MQKREDHIRRDEFFINIRKLAALDIVFHGPRLILAEFIFTVGLCGVLGVLSFSFFFRSANHPLFAGIIGLILSWVALNYVPLLLYTISFVRHKNAELEVVAELAHKERYARKYAVQSLLLVVPLAIPVLSIIQEWRKRSLS